MDSNFKTTNYLIQRSNYNLSYLKYESYFKISLFSTLKTRNQISQKLKNMKNKLSFTKNKIILKSKEKVSKIMKSTKDDKISKYCQLYLQLNKNHTFKKKSKTRDLFDKLNRKFQIGKQKYSNPDFDQIYNMLKTKFKLESSTLKKKIDDIKNHIFKMKRTKTIAKYSMVTFYSLAVGYMILRNKMNWKIFMLSTLGIVGIHMFSQYLITKFYLNKLRNSIF